MRFCNDCRSYEKSVIGNTCIRKKNERVNKGKKKEKSDKERNRKSQCNWRISYEENIDNNMEKE